MGLEVDSSSPNVHDSSHRLFLLFCALCDSVAFLSVGCRQLPSMPYFLFIRSTDRWRRHHRPAWLRKLGAIWHCVTLGSKNGNQKPPLPMAIKTCHRCTWHAKASSPKKCSSSPSAKKSNPNSFAAKSPAAAPSSPPTFIT